MGRVTFLSITLCFFFSSINVDGSTLVVTDTTDSGTGSLRNAISLSAPGDTILFDSSIGGQSILLTSGELVVDKALFIYGNDSLKTTINANNNSRIFNVLDSNTSTIVTLKNLKLLNGNADFGGAMFVKNGHVRIMHSELNNNFADSSGGAVFIDSNSRFEAANTIFSQNQTIVNERLQGGGAIFNDGGKLIIRSTSKFLDNNSNGSGGGLFSMYADTLIIDSSSFSDNSSSLYGGGICIFSDTLDVLFFNALQLDSNVAENGGGSFVSGTVEISNSKFKGNLATSSSGGGLRFLNGKCVLKKVEFIGNERLGNFYFVGTGGGAISLSSARLEIYNSFFSNNRSDSYGGAIVSFEDKGILIDSSNFKGNTANSGGGIFVIQSPASMDSLYISNSSLDSNIANVRGGALNTLINSGQTVTTSIKVSIVNTKLRYNRATWAGAIFNDQDNMRLEGVQLDSNTSATNGGALMNNGGSIQIINSSISNNNSLAAPHPTFIRGGGGIYNYNSGNIVVENSTISNNHSTNHGGGILNQGFLSVKLSTFAENKADSSGGAIAQRNSSSVLEIASSIVAKNVAHSGSELYQTSGVITSFGYNIVGIDDASVFTQNVGDQVGTVANPVDPLLDTLIEYQGQTKIHKLKCGSPAIDAASSIFVSADQTGAVVFNNRRDIGAFELQSNCSPVNLKGAGNKKINESYIYPNPQSSEVLNVMIPDALGNDVRLEIIGISSKLLLKEKQLEVGHNRIDLSNLKSGIYFLLISGKNKVEIHKLIHH